MVLRRVGVLSAGKISGLFGVIFGLIAGGFFALMSMLGAAVSSQAQGSGALPAVFVGIGSVVILPIFYGVICFISGIIYAALYNVSAGIIGGLELHFDSELLKS
jgi:hypothetical protein